MAMPGFAAEIKMRNGQFYKNATIVRRDEKMLRVMMPFGLITVPLASVESIDGVKVWATPTPTLEPSATPEVSPMMPAPAENGTLATTPAEASLAPSASPMGTPLAEESPIAPAPSPWPVFVYRWNMDALLLAVATLGAFWLGSIASMQRDLFERRADPRFWTTIAILLPGLGFGLYRAAQSFGDMRARAKKSRNPNEVVADRERGQKKEAQRNRRRGFEFLDEDRKAVLLKKEGGISGIENAQDVLEEALLERASDVHIEPAENEYRVRFRIDGLMHPRMSFDRGDGQRLVSALKTLAQIDVAEKRKAQDGRFRVRTGDNDVDFRVATANSIFGEKLVIRILDRQAGLLGLGNLGMPQAMLEEFARVIHSRNGMILATGPTGSGKTSTLYAALSQIDVKRLNVMTIEDPVEYELAGATQIPVNPKAGVTFESGLRSLLRQDPDVIFVGEMRDLEAGQIALRAALTGHLVFSSLHTKDAVGTVIRLEEMGIERHLLSSALFVLLAQRLVRVLCPACREAYPCRGDEMLEIGIELPEGETIYRSKGCDACEQTGYTGRTGIFEMMVFDEELRQAVNSDAGEDELARLARTKGFRGYREDGAEKVLLGITSVEEVLQAI